MAHPSLGRGPLRVMSVESATGLLHSPRADVERTFQNGRLVPQACMRVAPNSAELLERSVRALWEHANPNRIAAVPIPAMSRSVTDIGGRNATGLEVDMKWPSFAVTLAAVASIGTATLAQDAWPTKAVVVVAPFAGGGNNDV